MFSGPFIVMLGHMLKDCARFLFLYMEFYLPFSECLCVCVCVWVHEGVRACMHVCVCAYVCACMHVRNSGNKVCSHMATT